MDERPRQSKTARTAAALFGAAGVVTLLSILPPHKPQLDREGLAFVAAGAGLVGAVLLSATGGTLALLVAIGSPATPHWWRWRAS